MLSQTLKLYFDSYYNILKVFLFVFLKITVCFFFNVFIFIIYFIFGCVGSSLLRAGFLQLRQAGATLRCGARASHCGGFSCCGARALGTQASVVVARRLQIAGSVVVVHGLSCSGHVGSSRTRARTRVPCIGRRIHNHCATREALLKFLYNHKYVVNINPLGFEVIFPFSHIKQYVVKFQFYI